MKGEIMKKQILRRLLAAMLCIAALVALKSAAFAEVKASEKGKPSGPSASSLQYGAIPVKKASASSVLVETVGGNTYSYPASNAVDGDIGTAWIEGAKGAGAGEAWGQTLLLEFDGVYDVSRIDFWLGWARTRELFEMNKKPWSLEVSFSNGDVYTLEFDNLSFKDTVKAPQTWNLSRPIRASWVEFKIMSVYKGWDGVDDTCISEIACFD